MLRASIPELSDELRIRNEPTVITYKVNVAEAAVQRTRITFRNSDRQEVAGMAIDLIVPAERPR